MSRTSKCPSFLLSLISILWNSLAPTRLNDWYTESEYDLSYLQTASNQEIGIEQLLGL